MQHENQGNILADLEFDHIARQHIRTMAQWGMIIVILAVVGYVINLIEIFTTDPLAAATSSQREGFGEFFTAMRGTGIGTVLFTTAVGLLIHFFLFRFSSQSKSAIDRQDMPALGRSFAGLKVYFMIGSILIIIFFALMLLGVAIALNSRSALM